MAELNYEQMQARALDRMEMASSASSAGKDDVAQRYTADAQTYALLYAGMAIRQLALAIRGTAK
ncbi:MAG: hypothetical protein LBV60_00795 [Streptomyces sp.]|jgi:hypothetical protein|nr:hypothetical protein [Streptomyces sp.]